MSNDITDITKGLFGFLWSRTHSERSGIAAGSGTDYIFEVDEGDLEEFEKLYVNAAIGCSDDIDDNQLPLKCVTRSKGDNEDNYGVAWTEGPYNRQYPGYNLDGFYESGPSIHIDCEKHLAFRVVNWYYDRFTRRVCCSYDQPFLNERYVVCITKNKEKENG